MTKIRPTRVRASYARSKARMYLREMKLSVPSIPVMDLIRLYGKIKWHKDAEDGFIMYNSNRKKYTVSIDETMIKGRITWTMCHELAHIVLGHFIEFDVDRLTDAEYLFLEREANIFTKELLMPEEWVKAYCEHPLTVSNLGKLKNTFDVSWEAIINRLDELKIYTKEHISALFENWNMYVVKESLTSYKLQRPNSIKITINFCTSKGVGLIMEPLVLVEADENLRFKKCSSCGNTEFSSDASYCRKCGCFLHNYCSNMINSSSYCGKPNAPDALYCEYCGSITLMGQAIKELQESKKQVAAGSQNYEDEDEDKYKY